MRLLRFERADAMPRSRDVPGPLGPRKTGAITTKVLKAAVNRGSVKRAKSGVVNTVDKTVDKPESNTSVDESGLSIDIQLLFPPLDE